MGTNFAEACDVLVVGAGPTGLYAACLLGEAGLKTVVLERAEKLRPHGGATNLHAETLTNLQRAGLGEYVGSDVNVQGFRDRPEGMPRPPTIRLLYNGQRADATTPNDKIFSVLGGSAEGAFSLPSTGYIYQGNLEKALMERALKHPGVSIKFGQAVDSLSQDESEVRVQAGGVAYTSKYLIAADGATSFCRKQLGVEWLERGGAQKKLAVVYDLKAKSKATLDKMHYWHGAYVECSPERPMVFMPMPKQHPTSDPAHAFIFRYVTWPCGDETQETMCSEPFVSTFLKERCGLEVGVDAELDRAVPYWLRHRVTEEYVKGRVVFVGDAAHVMGPFLGQGVCHGLRDVANAVWKARDTTRRPREPSTLCAPRLAHASRARGTRRPAGASRSFAHPSLSR